MVPTARTIYRSLLIGATMALPVLAFPMPVFPMLEPATTVADSTAATATAPDAAPPAPVAPAAPASAAIDPVPAAPPAAATTPPAAAGPEHALAVWRQARQAFDAEAAAYWRAVADKRRQRHAKRRDGTAITLDDYVLTQPPLYDGPPPPRTGTDQPEAAPRKYIPVVADFLKSAQDHFGFVPDRPHSELDFKRAYAALALDAGLTRDQIVRIYVFETGGNGAYDSQAGLEYSAKAHAVSPALGYNQLLNTNSVELLAEKGDAFVARLQARAAASHGDAKAALERKIAVLRRMIELSRTVPDEWKAHDTLANTPAGLGVHALLLDVDVGPFLQVQKLLDSVAYARRQGRTAPLSAAELEMMNLTGDGNGFDIVMMPAALRDRVPTANFFLQGGYERNKVAIRNNVVSKLLAVTDAAMDRGASLPGARELAGAATTR